MQFRLAGAGLFKDGRLVGWMAPAQARGALWLLGTATRGTVTVQTPEGATVTMSLDSAHIARRAVLRDGSPAVVIEIVARDSLLDVQGGPLRLDKAGTADELGRLLAQRIIERAGEALAQAQSMDVDVFNFGDLIASYQPRAWRVMAATWPAAFAQIPVTIQAKGVVKGTGNLTNVPSSG